MFSYRKIVFGIKHRYQISNVLEIFKQQRYYSILISQHNAIDVDNCCDRPDVHYHGLVEFSVGEKEGKLRKFVMHLSPYCTYINDDHCSNPAEYLAYITLAPKQVITREILTYSELLNYLQIASSMKVQALERKMDRRVSLLERDGKVVRLVEFILKSGYDHNLFCNIKKKELLLRCFNEMNEANLNMPQEIITTALSISQKIVLNSSILDLCERFESPSDYLSPEESAQFVLDWCSYQKLDPKAFSKNLIRCLDKKGGNCNSIYLQGSANSGKTYIVESIISACIFVGQVIVESSSYSFVWENCVDKRLIVLRELYFSLINFDQLDKILSCSGTLIYKHNDFPDYVMPTPVIILANEHDWIVDEKLSKKIRKRFLCCYMNLKEFNNKNVKKLHPQWLSLLHKTFSIGNRSKVKGKEAKISYGSSLESNLGTNDGMQLREDRMKDDDKKVNSHSLETSSDCDESTTKISVNTKRDSENAIQPNPKYMKRLITDTRHDGRRNKEMD